jgi:hypothetical protein
MSESQVVAYTRATAALIGPIAVQEELEPISVPPTVRWHTYRWDGAGFGPFGSPVDIPIGEPTGLSLTATTATAGWVVTLTLTVHNGGTTPTDFLYLSFLAEAQLVLRHGTVTYPDMAPGPDTSVWSVFVAAIPPGESATGTFTLEFPPEAAGSTELTVTVFGYNGRPEPLPNADTTNQVKLALAV